RTEESSHLWCDEVVEQATVGAIYKNLLDFVVSALLLHHFQKLIRAAKDFSSRPLHANVVAQIISSRNIVPVAHRFDVGHHSFFCAANHTNLSFPSEFLFKSKNDRSISHVGMPTRGSSNDHCAIQRS